MVTIKCRFCGSTVRPSSIIHTLNQFFSYVDIPAVYCSECDKFFITYNVARRIESIMESSAWRQLTSPFTISMIDSICCNSRNREMIGEELWEQDMKINNIPVLEDSDILTLSYSSFISKLNKNHHFRDDARDEFRKNKELEKNTTTELRLIKSP